MSQKRHPSPPHSKRPNAAGKLKDRRHGTGHWVTWIEEARMGSLPGRAGRPFKNRKPRRDT